MFKQVQYVKNVKFLAHEKNSNVLSQKLEAMIIIHENKQVTKHNGQMTMNVANKCNRQMRIREGLERQFMNYAKLIDKRETRSAEQRQERRLKRGNKIKQVENDFKGYHYLNNEGVQCHTFDYEQSIGE